VNTMSKVLFLSTVPLLCLAAAVPARADWLFAHGNVAIVQEDALANFESIAHMGWGLDVKLKSGKTAWVQFPIPTIALENRSVSAIQLVFDMVESNKTAIIEADLWDGGVFLKTIKGVWTGRWKTITLTLDQKIKLYRGLNVSLLLKNASKSKDYRVVLQSVGARITN
jgi:hypothetical protein